MPLLSLYPGPANSEPYAMCDEGWYCPGNDTLAQPSGNRCAAGHKCPQGSYQQEPCPSGFYQPLTEQGECIECPAGNRVISNLNSVI